MSHTGIALRADMMVLFAHRVSILWLCYCTHVERVRKAVYITYSVFRIRSIMDQIKRWCYSIKSVRQSSNRRVDRDRFCEHMITLHRLVSSRRPPYTADWVAPEPGCGMSTPCRQAGNRVTSKLAKPRLYNIFHWGRHATPPKPLHHVFLKT